MKTLVLSAIVTLVLVGTLQAAAAQAASQESPPSLPAAEAGAPSRQGPPPEAFAACVGKSAGATAQFTNRRGEVVTGTCEERDGKLVLRPDRPKGDDADGKRRGPPPEAYTACQGKSVGAAAQFVTPRGETVTGTCQEEDGKLVLRPDRPKGSAAGGTEECRRP